MSQRRPVIAYHLILTCYGFWLPNDPRGSGSAEVWSEALRPFGPATKVKSERSVAARTHDRALRLAAKRALHYPPVRFDGLQARAVARGFAAYVRKYDVRCLGCAVLPDHAHLVLERQVRPIERLATGLKAATVHALLEEGLHPYQDHDAKTRPKVWARGARHPFLFGEAGIRRAVRYVEENPVHAHLPPQKWSFVRPVEPQLAAPRTVEPRTK